MKPSTNRGDIRGRQMGGRSPAETGQAGPGVGRGQSAEIPPYLLSPEGLEAPLPEVTDLLPATPLVRQGTGAPVPPSHRAGPPGHDPAHAGRDPHGFKPRHASVAPLREHRVHGRGQ